MYLPVKLKNGGDVYVEIEPAQGGQPGPGAAPTLTLPGEAMGPTTAVAMAEKQFADAVRVAQGIADEVTEGLVNTSRSLSEVEVELSLGFSAEGHVFLAKGGATATLKLTLKWDRSKP